jgi:hypothetical protein
MSFRPNHRQSLPQPCAEAGVRAWLLTMQRGGKLIGVRPSAAVDAHASDPGGGVVY